MRISDGVQTCALPIYDHRDPWNRPGQEPEQHCWPGCGGTGRPAPTRETGDPCRTCRQAPTLHGCYGGVLRSASRRPSLRCAGARSEEHTSELQSLMRISYAVFCLNKKNNKNIQQDSITIST